MITHDQANDLLGAFALDAVDNIEHDQIESHLKACPRCAADVGALREVASALGNCVERVPEGLWSVISSRLTTPEDGEPLPPLLKILSRAETIEKEPRSPAIMPRSRSGRRYLMVVTSVAAAAAAVAAAVVLGLGVVRTSDQNDRLQTQIGTNSSSVVAALETPGHTLVSLRGANHVKVAQFVLLPSGRGYLVSSSLPKLKADQTYQLWGIIGGQTISLGLLGPAPTQAAFTVASSGDPSQLGVTVEPAGGSIVPTTTMLASTRI